MLELVIFGGIFALVFLLLYSLGAADREQTRDRIDPHETVSITTRAWESNRTPHIGDH